MKYLLDCYELLIICNTNPQQHWFKTNASTNWFKSIGRFQLIDSWKKWNQPTKYRCFYSASSVSYLACSHRCVAVARDYSSGITLEGRGSWGHWSTVGCVYFGPKFQQAKVVFPAPSVVWVLIDRFYFVHFSVTGWQVGTAHPHFQVASWEPGGTNSNI